MGLKSNGQILQEVKSQLVITLSKVDEALIDSQKEYYSEFHSKTFAAAKRSALDLKSELTKLTQSSKYKYGTN
jgi:hypothetical protein